MLIEGNLQATMLVLRRLPSHERPDPKMLIKGATKPPVWLPP